MRCHYLIFNTIFQKQLTALHWRRYAMYQQIVVKRGNLILLIVNPQDNTGLCHYVISVRKTSVIGSTKRELKVMKSFKYKNFLLHGATPSTIILFFAQILDFHRIDAIFDILSICKCRQFRLRTGIWYDCSLLIQQFLAYKNRKRMFTH